MSQPRNTYKFTFKVGNKVVRTGVTTNLVRRERRLRDSQSSAKVDSLSPLDNPHREKE